MAEHRFAVGERVTWNPEQRGDGWHKKCQDRYGDGPFEVASIRPVQTDCHCTYKLLGMKTHLPFCAVYNVQRVGHSQWVTIKLLDFVSSEFSGVFLIPAP